MELHCRLSFDPTADRIVIRDLNYKSVLVKPLDGGCLTQPTRSIELKTFFFEMLEPGSWALITNFGHHILNLSILPRRNVEITRTPDEPMVSAFTGRKRQYEPSQPTTGESKKTRSKEDVSADQASIVFQPAPKVSEVQADPQLQVVPGQQRSSPAIGGREGNAVLGLRHPFEDLRPGDRAKIIGPNGEDYTLSYDKMLSIRTNSHVFTAQHSDHPEKLMVVKVVRSPAGLIAPGESRQVGEKVHRMGELWLREVTIHAQLSQHVSAEPTISSILTASGRPLTIAEPALGSPSL